MSVRSGVAVRRAGAGRPPLPVGGGRRPRRQRRRRPHRVSATAPPTACCRRCAATASSPRTPARIATTSVRGWSPSAAGPRPACASTACCPASSELAATTGESVSLGTRVGDEVLIVLHVDSPQPLRFDQAPGTHVPVHASAIGKALLAFADDPAAEVAALGELVGVHAGHADVARRRCWPTSRRPAGAAGRSTTASVTSACARWPPRCSTTTAGRGPASRSRARRSACPTTASTALADVLRTAAAAMPGDARSVTAVDPPPWHLAELNVARLRQPLDHPDTAEFVAALDGDQRPGRVVARLRVAAHRRLRPVVELRARRRRPARHHQPVGVGVARPAARLRVPHRAHAVPAAPPGVVRADGRSRSSCAGGCPPARSRRSTALARLGRLRRDGVSDEAFTLRDRRPPPSRPSPRPRRRLRPPTGAGSVVGRMERFGLVGLPNAGKSSLYNALTGGGALAAPYAFATKDPNIGVAKVPDERLDRLAEMSKSRNVVHAAVQVVDIGGLVEGASKGEGLGNKFLANIREVDAVVFVLRAFEDDDVTGPVRPDRAPARRRVGAGAGRPGDRREAPAPGPAAVQAGPLARRRGRRPAGGERRPVRRPPAVPRRAEAGPARRCWRRTSC